MKHVIAAITLLAALASTAWSAIGGTGTITWVQNGGSYNYSIKLQNTGSTNIGTFWFSWLPGLNFMPVQATSISAPANWSGFSTGGGLNDGYGIEYTASTPLAPGQTADGFTFTSTATPAQMTGDSAAHPGNNVGTAVLYEGSPFVGQTTTIIVTPPAPSLSSISISPSSVTSGANATGTATLDAAAPTGGVVVALSSNNTDAATVPASVTVPSGATSATFTVASKGVDTATSVTITGVAGATKTGNVTVNPAALSNLSIDVSSVVGGQSATGTVTLNGKAGPSGTIVSLSSNDVHATVPSSALVTTQTTSVDFVINTTAVSVNTIATITAHLGAVTKTADLTIDKAPVLTGLSLNPSTVQGGQNTTGTVTLSFAAPAGGVVVTTSDNTSVITTPPSVTVAAGATQGQFTCTTFAVATTVVRTVSASLNGVTKNANLTLTPGPALSALSVNPSTIVGGQSTTGTVTLSQTSGTNTVVGLSSGSSVLHVPASVTVLAGHTTASFTVTSNAVSSNVVRTISANYNGVTKNAAITLTVGSSVLTGLSVNPSTVKGGNDTTGTITLSGPAPAGGAVVTVSSASSVIVVPPTVTVPAGASTVNFTVHTKAVGATATRTISASYNSVTKMAALTLTP